MRLAGCVSISCQRKEAMKKKDRNPTHHLFLRAPSLSPPRLLTGATYGGRSRRQSTAPSTPLRRSTCAPSFTRTRSGVCVPILPCAAPPILVYPLRPPAQRPQRRGWLARRRARACFDARRFVKLAGPRRARACFDARRFVKLAGPRHAHGLPRVGLRLPGRRRCRFDSILKGTKEHHEVNRGPKNIRKLPAAS